MKLSYKKTILVGFAFFLISAFWQAYDTVVPLILTNKFNMQQTWSGLIMSLDNIFAVFMLPLFGALSDKVNTPWGKRTPFIVVGTVLASIFFIILGFTTSLALFIAMLLCSLLSMAIFRSPAVALMPDVTVKPLRSKANAIINLMGTAGGIIVLAFGIIFKTSTKGKTDFAFYMISVVAIMIVALVVFLLTVREKKWAAQMEEDSKEIVEVNKNETDNVEKRKLTKSEFTSLLLILASVALWYIGYNAVTSKYSVYASEILQVEYTVTLMVAQIAAIISYIPVGLVASKIGRKKTILFGIIMLTGAFLGASFVKAGTSPILMYALFCLAGIGWATINVNSFPMVVELAKVGNVGKYTGFYYTASMSAQIVTPILSGLFIDHVGWWTFFPYATIFVGLAFVTMFFVKHGDSKPVAKSFE
ncbi:MAG: SLC45 family MFS transporter [Clostridiales bacterium]|nr:SLC45 family MFS transporter [Clostridiales bacterium]